MKFYRFGRGGRKEYDDQDSEDEDNNDDEDRDDDVTPRCWRCAESLIVFVVLSSDRSDSPHYMSCKKVPVACAVGMVPSNH